MLVPLPLLKGARDTMSGTLLEYGAACMMLVGDFEKREAGDDNTLVTLWSWMVLLEAKHCNGLVG